MVGKNEGSVEVTERYLEGFRLGADLDRARMWDSKLPGFGVVIGKRRISFVVQRRIKGDRTQSSVTLGHWAPSKLRAADDGLRSRTISVQMARGAAIEALSEMRKGSDPRGERSEDGKAIDGPTLSEAIDLHVKRMRADDAAPRSIESIKSETSKHLHDWLDKPLASITRTMCRERHEELAENSGSYLANRVMRHLRAAWNTALKEIDLPASPTIAVHWKKERRRQEPIAWDKLPAWKASVDEIENAVRRDYQIFVLLTGLRKMDAATIRWEHVDFDDATLTRPNPKGGKERAFTIPLSTACIEILKRRQQDNVNDAGWVFPTDVLGAWKRKDRECHLCAALGLPAMHEVGGRIHLIEPAEARRGLVTPHRLRDTYTSALAALDPPVSAYVIDVLTNHRPPKGSVTAGYIDLSAEDLRAAQERVSVFLVGKYTAKKHAK